MSILHGPNLVKDGLVLYLDAANSKSYPRSGTVWTDLIGTNTGTLTNGASFNSVDNGSILFDGSNDYVDVANQANFTFANTTFTIGVWFRRTVSTVAVVASKGGDTGGWNLFAGQAFSAQLKNSSGFSVFNRDSEVGSVVVNRWNYITAVVTTSTTVSTNNSSTLYVNGVRNQQAITYDPNNYVYNPDTTTLQLGRRSDSTFHFSGNMGIIQIYNRGLTEVEILQNFNATRSRFGV